MHRRPNPLLSANPGVARIFEIRANMRPINYRLAAILTLTAMSGRHLMAKEKSRKPEPAKQQDQIVVDAHLPAGEGAVTRFIATRHYDRSYVYAQRANGKPALLIDVTNPSHPQILSEVNYTEGIATGELLAVAGTAALAGGVPGAQIPVAQIPAAQTIRLMDFSDPANPKVTRQFDGVTAIQMVGGGGVIMLANADGIWILSQRFAEDPEVEKRYAYKVIYGESR
jgi:hypothetical protein